MNGHYIYTQQTTPFDFGDTDRLIKTEVVEFERVDCGKGHFILVVKNPVKKLFHGALESCGAIIGTNKSKTAMIKDLKKKIETGSDELMTKQIEDGIIQCRQATELETDEFFNMFKGEEREVVAS